jgi:hypothetical protein
LIAAQGLLARTAVIGAAAASLMAGSLGGASHANATCFGISGINIGSGCHSTLGNIAIGLGNGAVAYSLNGVLNFAVALGDNSRANAYDGLANVALAVGESAYASGDKVGNLAVSFGREAAAQASGVANLAVALGDPGENAEKGYNRTEALIQGTLNVAVGLFGGSSANGRFLANASLALLGGYANAEGFQIRVAFPGQVNGPTAAPRRSRTIQASTPERTSQPASTSAEPSTGKSKAHAAPNSRRS